MTAWIPVESSNLAAIRYDAGAQTLDVAFAKGAVYRYFDVPGTAVQGLANAESVGKYFAAYVRTAYRYEKLDETWPTATGGSTDKLNEQADIAEDFIVNHCGDD